MNQPGSDSIRILYIEGSVVPPSTEPLRNRFSWLSGTLEGEVLQRVWWGDVDEVIRHYGDGSYPSHRIGGFRYHWLLSNHLQGIQGWRKTVRFFVTTGYRLHREQPFDCIVVYSHMTTGLCGVILKLLTGAKLVIEVMTSPQHVNLTNRPKPSLRDWLMHGWSDICLHISLLSADRVHLLAPQQITGYRLLRSIRRSVFPDFVVASAAQRTTEPEERYVLLVGAPWYLKGVDLAIQAFRRLEEDFPGVKLRLLGHFPEREVLDQLVGTSTQIEIMKAVPNNQALRIIHGALVLIHPTRCDGLPRVLMEAMSAGIPVIASRIGGIPHIVRDGKNGFLIPPNDAGALEDRLQTLLSDVDLRERMGNAGRLLAQQEFTERRWAEQFVAMVEATFKGLP
jgi:glycosyltransferase involved in cell wall biosynthesis